MRRFVLVFFTTMAVFVPLVGNAQVGTIQPTPPPQITGASAPWYLRGEPVFFAGNLYYPTGPDMFFDGKVMTQAGVYQGVPIYSDISREPYSMVLVPISSGQMRPYVRRPDAGTSGTLGFLPPEYRATRTGELTGNISTQPAPVVAVAAPPVVPDAAAATGTGGAAQPSRVRVEMIPEARTNFQGVWIEFDGARWFHAGEVVSYDADTFVPVGAYRGFPVYKNKSDTSETIYVSVVQNGPLAPYAKR
jgi:hypothetical protein